MTLKSRRGNPAAFSRFGPRSNASRSHSPRLRGECGRAKRRPGEGPRRLDALCLQAKRAADVATVTPPRPRKGLRNLLRLRLRPRRRRPRSRSRPDRCLGAVASARWMGLLDVLRPKDVRRRRLGRHRHCRCRHFRHDPPRRLNRRTQHLPAARHTRPALRPAPCRIAGNEAGLRLVHPADKTTEHDP